MIYMSCKNDYFLPLGILFTRQPPKKNKSVDFFLAAAAQKICRRVENRSFLQNVYMKSFLRPEFERLVSLRLGHSVCSATIYFYRQQNAA